MTEHSFFVNEKPEQRALTSQWNAYTEEQRTMFQLSATSENFTKAFKEKWNLVTQFGSGDIKQLDKAIREEVSKVDNEFEMNKGVVSW
jgi:acetylornithine/succinyldiaminopimelate/putrescine aminotransferase